LIQLKSFRNSPKLTICCMLSVMQVHTARSVYLLGANCNDFTGVIFRITGTIHP